MYTVAEPENHTSSLSLTKNSVVWGDNRCWSRRFYETMKCLWLIWVKQIVFRFTFC